MNGQMNGTRRRFLQSGLAMAAFSGAAPALAKGLAPFDLAFAGSMGAVMNGPIRAAAAKDLGIALRGRAQGAYGLAHLIVGGSIRPDAFVSVTAGPMALLFKAKKAAEALAVARTEMVIAYSPKSRFAARFAAAAKPGGEPWWKILESPGLRFGRTDPHTDPLGVNTLFLFQLAARHYGTPDLLARVLHGTVDPAQIFPEPQVMARLQSGQIDAASAYATQPPPLHLPALRLPAAINLGDPARAADYDRAAVVIGGKTLKPSPLVFYGAALTTAKDPALARHFIHWLRSPAIAAIFKRYHYDLPDGAAALRA